MGRLKRSAPRASSFDDVLVTDGQSHRKRCNTNAERENRVVNAAQLFDRSMPDSAGLGACTAGVDQAGVHAE